jgi:hypothetical protein
MYAAAAAVAVAIVAVIAAESVRRNALPPYARQWSAMLQPSGAQSLSFIFTNSSLQQRYRT